MLGFRQVFVAFFFFYLDILFRTCGTLQFPLSLFPNTVPYFGPTKYIVPAPSFPLPPPLPVPSTRSLKASPPTPHEQHQIIFPVTFSAYTH